MITAALAFNFFHAKPHHSLRIHEPKDVAIVGPLAVLGRVVSDINAWRRRPDAIVDRCERATNAPKLITELTSQMHPVGEVWTTVAGAVLDQLGLALCGVVHEQPSDMPLIFVRRVARTAAPRPSCSRPTAPLPDPRQRTRDQLAEALLTVDEEADRLNFLVGELLGVGRAVTDRAIGARIPGDERDEHAYGPTDKADKADNADQHGEADQRSEQPDGRGVQMSRVLVVDDEPQIRRALGLSLGARGYEVFEAATGEAALTMIADEHPEMVLLDLGLPGMDGIKVLHALRGWTDVPVIVLTARDDERSKVDALEAGADDYVTKPFGMAELIARIRAVLRRHPDRVSEAPEVVTAAFRLDLSSHRAFIAGGTEEVRLTPIEWGIVTYLVRSPHRLITYRQIVTAVWGPTYDPDLNLLRVHMGHIRRKLEPDPGQPAFFITHPGVGYRFETSA